MMVVAVLTVLLAMWQARDDAHAIAGGEPIDHSISWVTRAAAVLLLCGVLDSYWTAVPMAGLFNVVFRWDLNTRRGLPWDYISTSNYYDRAFIRVAGRHGGRLAYAVELAVLAAGIAARVVYTQNM